MLKKCIICVALVAVMILLFSKPFWAILIDRGYIPYTCEYDCKKYMNYYKASKVEFEVIINEITEQIDNLPDQWKERDEFIFFANKGKEWNIKIIGDQGCLYEQTEYIKNAQSIEQIANYFGEPLRGVGYYKNEKTYRFNIGEYYYINISEHSISVVGGEYELVFNP